MLRSRDLRETIQISQPYGLAVTLRQGVNHRLYTGGKLLQLTHVRVALTRRCWRVEILSGLFGSTSLSSKVIDNHVARDLKYPSWQSFLLPDRVDSAMNTDEDLLQDVFDVGLVAHSARDERPQAFVELAPNDFGA